MTSTHVQGRRKEKRGATRFIGTQCQSSACSRKPRCLDLADLRAALADDAPRLAHTLNLDAFITGGGGGGRCGDGSKFAGCKVISGGTIGGSNKSRISGGGGGGGGSGGSSGGNSGGESGIGPPVGGRGGGGGRGWGGDWSWGGGGGRGWGWGGD